MAVETPTRPSRYAAPKGGSSWELWSWWFMRLSGLLLVVLVLTHFTIMHLVDEGIDRVNFAFVAGRWTQPFWQVFDWLMLFLGMLHGGNGLKNIIHEYVRNPRIRSGLTAFLGVFVVAWIILGTIVILTFDPNQAVG